MEWQVLDWAKERGILEHSDPKSQALKTVEEVGEYASNILKGLDCKDDIGDIVITLILQCQMQKTTLTECLELAYEQIKNRAGTMQNGAFIKTTDTIKK